MSFWTNRAGATAAAIWANATRTLTSGGFPGFEAYRPKAISTISKALTATGSTDIVNVTEAGILNQIAIMVTTAPSGASPSADINITIDGGATQTIALYSGALNWDSAIKPFVTGQGVATPDAFPGDTIADTLVLTLGSRYAASLQVAINITVAAGLGGTVQASVLRSTKI